MSSAKVLRLRLHMWERLSPELEYRFSHLNKLVQEQRRYPDSASSSQPTEKLIDYSQANASPHSRRQQADDLANAKADLAVLRGHNASLKASLQATKEVRLRPAVFWCHVGHATAIRHQRADVHVEVLGPNGRLTKQLRLKYAVHLTRADAALAVERSAELQAQIADIRRVVQLSKQVANEKVCPPIAQLVKQVVMAVRGQGPQLSKVAAPPPSCPSPSPVVQGGGPSPVVKVASSPRLVRVEQPLPQETLVIIRDDAPDSEWWPEHHSSFKKALEQAEDWGTAPTFLTRWGWRLPVVELLGGDWEDTSALVQVMAELLQHSEQLALAAANKAAEAHSLRMDLDEAHRWLECADRGIGGKDDMREKAGKAASSSVKQRDELSLAGLEFKLAAVSGAARNARGSTAGPEAEGELAERSLEKKRVKELEEEVARMQAELARVQATLSETAMSSVEANSHMLKL
ncbi:hypothetical protein CYMTET_40217, partial [Cymbomonas tetramitiformis]